MFGFNLLSMLLTDKIRRCLPMPERPIVMIRAVVPFLSMVATTVAGLILVRKAADWGFIDLPNDRNVHTTPTPRTGGLAMILGGSLVYALSLGLHWIPTPHLPWQTWLAGLGFITVGALDDRYSFKPRQKFLVFLSLSALAAWPWVMKFNAANFSWLPNAWAGSFAVELGAAILITFWFMAVPNAVNIEDAINGYMGGFTFIVLMALLFRGVDTRIPLGALMGFLFLNWPKAKHFMGDAGSFGCGFFIAETILRAGGDRHPELALTLTAPIALDVLMGIIRRRRLGQSPFDADRRTLPHHLLDRTGSPALATPILWIGALLFAFCLGRPLAVAGLVLAFAAVLITFNWKFLASPSTLGH